MLRGKKRQDLEEEGGRSDWSTGEEEPLIVKTIETLGPFTAKEAIAEAFRISFRDHASLRAPAWPEGIDKSKNTELFEAWNKLIQLDLKDDKAGRDPFLLGFIGLVALISTLATAWLRRGEEELLPANLTIVGLGFIGFVLGGLIMLIKNLTTELNSNRAERNTTTFKYDKYFKKAQEPVQLISLDTALKDIGTHTQLAVSAWDAEKAVKRGHESTILRLENKIEELTNELGYCKTHINELMVESSNNNVQILELTKQKQALESTVTKLNSKLEAYVKQTPSENKDNLPPTPGVSASIKFGQGS